MNASLRGQRMFRPTGLYNVVLSSSTRCRKRRISYIYIDEVRTVAGTCKCMHGTEPCHNATSKKSLESCIEKKVSALSMNECRKLWAEMSISFIALIVSRNCVGVIWGALGEHFWHACEQNRVGKYAPCPPVLTDMWEKTAQARPRNSPARCARLLAGSARQFGQLAECRRQQWAVAGRNNMRKMVSRDGMVCMDRDTRHLDTT